VCLIKWVVVTAGIRALVAQVAVLMDVKAVFLCRAAVEALQTHSYRYVASLLYIHAHERIVSLQNSQNSKATGRPTS